jgi:transcription initiation factor TFIIF subunit alpha
MNQIQKNKEPERWLLRNRKGQAASEATAALLKSEASGSDGLPGSMAGSSRGGSRLRVVDSGTDDLFGGEDEDDAEARRRRAKELGRHGDIEEVDFEDVFEDDEQTMEVDEKEDDEAKDIEVGFPHGL